MKEIKQGFSRFYNRRHRRKGFFWSGRFKSVIVDNGETLTNCLAYIDLNPVRAGIVKKPEAYRWSSLGYHLQRKNEHEFLSLDFGLKEFGVEGKTERLRYYRKFVYEKGRVEGAEKERENNFEVTEKDRRFIGGVFPETSFGSHLKERQSIISLGGTESLKIHGRILSFNHIHLSFTPPNRQYYPAQIPNFS